MPKSATIGEPCPRCGESLYLEHSKSGRAFIGCAAYPKCRYTRVVEEGEIVRLDKPPTQEVTQQPAIRDDDKWITLIKGIDEMIETLQGLRSDLRGH